MIARYIGRDLERVWVLALLTGRLLTTGSAYPTGRSHSRNASFKEIEATGSTKGGTKRQSEGVETAATRRLLAG